MKRTIAAIAGLPILAMAAAHAQLTPGGVAMQPANSALAEEVHFFHNGILLPIITVISLFVLALLIWVIIRYNAKSNPVPRIPIVATAVRTRTLLGLARPIKPVT